MAKIINEALDPSPNKRPAIKKVLKCLESLPCCTTDEFKKLAAEVQELEMSPYTKKESKKH